MIVVFDQLKISSDGNKLLIGVHVNTADKYANVYLKSITIMDGNKVSETCPYAPTEEYLDKIKFSEEDKYKEYSAEISAKNLARKYETDVHAMNFTQKDMKKTLFFVYVEVTGAPASDTECGEDNVYTLGVTFYIQNLYEKVMNFTNTLVSKCEVPREFTDFILLWNALKAAIETGHYVAAIKFYNMLFGNMNDVSVISNCGCHG